MIVEGIVLTVLAVVLALLLLFSVNLFTGRRAAATAGANAGGSGGGEPAAKPGRFASVSRYLNAALGAPAAGKAPENDALTDDMCRLIGHNMQELDDIYGQMEREQRNAFNSALLVSFLGFGLLAAGIVLAFAQSGENLSVYTTVGGAIVEMISGLFFWIYNKCTKQLDKLYADLIETQKTLLSVQLVGRLSEANRDGAYLGVIAHVMEGDAAQRRAKKPKPAEPKANAGETADPSGTAPA